MSEGLRWDDLIVHLRDEAYATLDADPMSLLDADGAPGVKADLYSARLVGMDDNVVDDWWIPDPRPELMAPIRPAPRLIADDDPTHSPPPHARYVLQGAYATSTVAADYLIDAPRTLVPKIQPEGVTIAFLRYRRRL